MCASDLTKLCEDDRSEKLSLRKANEDNLAAKMKEFGLEPLSKDNCGLANATPGILKGIFPAHKDFGNVSESIRENKPWAVVSGINPSGPLHLGHLALFRENLALQKLGADVFIPVSNDESFLFDKAPSLEKAEEIAFKSVIPSVIAMGFNPAKTHIFVDSDFPSIYTFAIHIAKHFTLNHVKGVFGFTDEVSPAYGFYMGGVQMAHILMPQLPEFGGVRPVVVPVGIDQHPYIQVSRRVARKLNLTPPSELILKFMPSLAGPEHVKMSASYQNTAIYVTDTPDSAVKKIKTAYTGGSPVLKYQQENGGIPEVCSVFGVLQYHLLDADESSSIALRCKEGLQKCKECKEAASEGIAAMLQEHQKAFNEALNNIEDFMIKTPIKSFRFFK